MKSLYYYYYLFIYVFFKFGLQIFCLDDILANIIKVWTALLWGLCLLLHRFSIFLASETLGILIWRRSWCFLLLLTSLQVWFTPQSPASSPFWRSWTWRSPSRPASPSRSSRSSPPLCRSWRPCWSCAATNRPKSPARYGAEPSRLPSAARR